MPRKARTVAVIDTSVFVRAFLNPRPSSSNLRILRLWVMERRLQLVVNPFIVDEYVRILRRKKVAEDCIVRFQTWLRLSSVTHVRTGSRRKVSDDRNDDPFIDAAEVGRADYIVSNDPHLYDIPAQALRGFRFQIVKPRDLLAALGE